jgi:hypothetical protein
MAQELIQYGDITPHQYVSVIKTGNLDDVTEDIVNENLLMRNENETMMDGEKPILTITDSHKAHIDYHRSILFDPDLRKDPTLVQIVTMHIQEHIDALRKTDPALLMLLNQQPLPPLPDPNAPPPPGNPPGAGGPPGPGPQPPGNHPAPSAKEMVPPEQGMTGPGVVGNKVIGAGMQTAQSLPGLPKVNPNLLSNPQAQQPMGNLAKPKGAH